MNLFFWTLIFLISLGILIKAADIFSDNAEKIGLALGIPAFIVGVTIVSVGTSLPELVSSIVAARGGNTEIVVGGILGSNIANIFLILGLASIIAKSLHVTFDLIHVDLPLLVGSSFLFGLMSIDRSISRVDGILLLLGALIYFIYTSHIHQTRNPKEKKEDKQIEKVLKKEHKNHKNRQIRLSYLFFIAISLLLIIISANFTVKSVIEISNILKIGKDIVAVSVVALGTSLPELVIAIDLAVKGKSEMVVGSILGSNIFNTFAVGGISALITPLTITDNLFYWALPFMIAASLIYFFTTQEKKLTQWEGMLMVLFYVFFITEIINIST